MRFKAAVAAFLSAALVFVSGCGSMQPNNNKDKDKDDKDNRTTSSPVVIPHGSTVMGGTDSSIGGSKSAVSSEGHAGIGSSAGRGGSVSAAS